MRCEVFVDFVHNIEIETNTRTLYKDEIENNFVVGFDKVGNRFSTLEGLEFKWELNTSEVIKFSAFKDSNYQASNVLMSMENKGLQSSLVLVKAVKIGVVKVRTTLIEQKYFDRVCFP